MERQMQGSEATIANLSRGWESKGLPSSIAKKKLQEDFIVRDLLLQRPENIVNVAQEQKFAAELKAGKEAIALLEAQLKAKRDEVVAVAEKQRLFLGKKLAIESRIGLIHETMRRRELYVANLDMAEELDEEDVALLERLEALRVEAGELSGAYISLMMQWEKLRSKAAAIYAREEDAHWQEEAAYFEATRADEDTPVSPSPPPTEEGIIIDMDGDEAEEPMHATPPPPSLPAVPEDENEVSLQKFSGYVPVRINRGKNQGIRAYFLDYESPKVVLVRLDKDPLENATVFKSSISRITCSVNGCPHLAVKPKRTSPYDFASLLCSEH